MSTTKQGNLTIKEYLNLSSCCISLMFFGSINCWNHILPTYLKRHYEEDEISNKYYIENSILQNAFNLSMKPKSAFVEKINEHYNVSKKAEEYSNLINNSFIEFEPFEAEDNEMRKKMEEFDKDLFNTISSIQNNVVKNISIKPIKIGKYEMEKLTKKALSPINTINNKNKNNFSTAIQQFYNQSESDEDKEENSNFMTINNTKTYKINSNINTSLLSSSYSENNKYIEIKYY